jgi:23S rRNA pseudouridine1911/1915/1917 synthase
MPSPPASGRIENFHVAPEEQGSRLDRFIATRLPELSRTRVQELIDQGRVRVSGQTPRSSHRLSPGERVEVEVLARPSLDATAEDIPIELLYEDEDLVVVNKRAGMMVHAGAGETHGTLVNALLHRLGDLSEVGGAVRPGIVHRLDRGTSGVLVVARNDQAHRALADQFQERHVEKYYLALLHGTLRENSGSINLPISRDLVRRTRMTTRRREGREARTDWRVLLRFPGFTLVEARLHTGRTHQIRVHFSSLGHPVAGDVTYGAPRLPRIGNQRIDELNRTFLHAARIVFAHPRTGKRTEVRAPLAPELQAYLHQLARISAIDETRIDAALKGYL